MTRSRCIALVPARRGSRRIPNKNVRRLAGHPLMAYTIAAARRSGVFERVIVSTDSEEYAAIARHYGAEVPWLRPPELATDAAPDIGWVTHVLDRLREADDAAESFAILRPTSPFRTPYTIRRAWRTFLEAEGADSVRAVELCRQHPGKMWVVDERWMTPLFAGGTLEQPWHSSPYQSLPRVFVQNASLEIAWTRVVTETRTIAGSRIAPFMTRDHEGVDLNDREDWIFVEALLAGGTAMLPRVDVPAYAWEDAHEAA